jgi:hypothetical protein
MREVLDNLDLAQIQAEKRGYILNARTDRKKLHRSGCETVGAMVSTAYPKVFFEELDEACKTLNAKYGESGWTRCGVCHPW